MSLIHRKLLNLAEVTYPKHLFLFPSEPYPKSIIEMLTCCPGDDLIIHDVFLSPHFCLAPTLEMYPEVVPRGIGWEHWILTVFMTETLATRTFNFVFESYVVECSIESFMHKDSEVNLSVFVYRLFHEDFSLIVGTNLELNLY